MLYYSYALRYAPEFRGLRCKVYLVIRPPNPAQFLNWHQPYVNFNCINQHLDLPFRDLSRVLMAVEQERKAAVNIENKKKAFSLLVVA